MTDFWQDVLKLAAGGLITVVGQLLYAWYTGRQGAGITRANESKTSADAAAVAARALVDTISFYEKERKDKEEREDKLEGRITELETRIDYDAEGRKIRDGRITELEQHIEKLNRDYAAALGALQEKYNKLKQYTEKLVQALQDANIDVPAINGELTDSVKGLKLWGKQ